MAKTIDFESPELDLEQKLPIDSLYICHTHENMRDGSTHRLALVHNQRQALVICSTRDGLLLKIAERLPGVIELESQHGEINQITPFNRQKFLANVKKHDITERMYDHFSESEHEKPYASPGFFGKIFIGLKNKTLCLLEVHPDLQTVRNAIKMLAEKDSNTITLSEAIYLNEAVKEIGEVEQAARQAAERAVEKAEQQRKARELHIKTRTRWLAELAEMEERKLEMAAETKETKSAR